ncbi:hypothetical protein FH832_002877 [Listeria monocytogenes]|nr:hypothetical protein [Listeria monocytogenes]
MSKLYSLYPILVLISAFGPYLSVSLGIKSDSLLIFMISPLFLLCAFLSNITRVKTSLFIIFAVWSSSVVYLLMRTLLSNTYSLSSIIAEMKNLGHPIAIMMALMFVIFRNKDSGESLIIKSSHILIYLLSLNTVWIFIGFFVDLSAINQWFWRGDESVAYRAMSNGRFSGIFNQPMEAGIAYTIGLFAWVYLMDKRAVKIGLKYTLLLSLIIVGGLLSVSKVFIFGGLLIFIVNCLSIKSIRSRIVRLVILIVLIGFPVYELLSHTWNGFQYLFRFFDANNQQQGLLSLLTAGRYGGTDAHQSSLFKSVWESNRMYGEGLGSQKVIDSAFFHFFGTGGLIGLALYILILISIAFVAIRFYLKYKGNAESRFLICIAIIIVLSSSGAPVLTLNRSSVIVWMFLSILISYLSLKAAEKPQEQVTVVSKITTKQKTRKLIITW